MRFLRRLSALCLIAAIALQATAQTGIDFRSEQVFVTSDRMAYNPGDTIRVKGIAACMTAENSLPYSRYVYIELINPRDSVMSRHKVTCQDRGYFNTEFKTDRLLLKGTYFLRAYTRFMQNFTDESFALSPLQIGLDLPVNDHIIDHRTSLEVAVQDNRLFPGFPQKVFGLISTYNGFPVKDRTVVLLDNHNDTVATSKTSITGVAEFMIVPVTDHSYRMSFSSLGMTKQTPLPPVISTFPKITAVAKKSNIMFSISGKIPSGARLFTFDRSNGLSELSSFTSSGKITVGKALFSPVTLFLVNENLDIISECSVMPASLSRNPDGNQLHFAKGDSVELSTIIPDHADCRVITRIVPEDDIWNIPARESLLFRSDFASEFPAHCLAYDTEAWLAAARFNRFKLDESIRNIDNFSYHIAPETELRINGTVYDDANAKHPMKKGTIVVYNNNDRLPFECTTDEQGHFSVAVSDFPDGTEFFLQGINNKGVIKSTIIHVDNDTFPLPRGLASLRPFARNRYSEAEVSIEGDIDERNRQLPDVVVKARVQHEEKSNDKEFYGVRLKTRKQIEERNYQSLREIIRDMPFVIIRKYYYNPMTGKTSEVPCNGCRELSLIASKSRIGDDFIPLVIDGTSIEKSQIDIWLDMPADNFESVEHLNIDEAKRLVPFAMGGAIDVRTRKLGPSAPNPSKGTRIWPAGLTVTESGADTILKVPDKSGRYRLFIDKIDADGTISSSIKEVEVTE